MVFEKQTTACGRHLYHKRGMTPPCCILKERTLDSQHFTRIVVARRKLVRACLSRETSRYSRPCCKAAFLLFISRQWETLNQPVL